MKNKHLLLWFLSIVTLNLLVFDLEARGGGRGGGGRVGGAGQTLARTPSMSQVRPSPNVRAAPQRVDNTQAKAQVQQYLQTNRRPLQTGNIPTQTQRSFGNTERIQQSIRDKKPNMNNWFNDSFWRNQGFHPYANRPAENWWGGSNWANTSTWLGYGWGYPYYYDSGYPSYYVSDTYQQQPDQQQTPQPTVQAPVQKPTQQPVSDILPLGVFALAANETAAANSNMFVQLVLNKDGTIGGTYYNSTTNLAYPVEGLVDKSTQRVAVKLSNNPYSPVLDTGLYNLTLNETLVQIYFYNKTTQNWLLVRMTQ